MKFLQQTLCLLLWAGVQDAQSNAVATECFNDMEVAFKPAHFSCTSCDVTSCDGQHLICDLAQCTGQMLMEECWCTQDPSATTSPAVKLLFSAAAGLGASSDGVIRVHCDENCLGGACDTAGLQCRKKAEACQPWWLCSEEPPVPSLLEVSSSQLVQNHGRDHALRGLRHRLRRKVLRAEELSSRQYNFQPASFKCDTAFIPPMVEEAVTHKLKPAGVIVLDKRACSGSVLQTKCVCWDNHRYLLGEDPFASDFLCDASCQIGVCGGRTCALHAPLPLQPSDTAEVDVDQSELHITDNVMSPAIASKQPKSR
mmetsp:Transcript_52857/g.123690  ORF Transcript_52857/g.123690 Transcript_52857/m.123690 type:complete len:312 (+) Transcript_52857:109-1044(+)